MIRIKYTKSFDTTYKKLKRHIKEKEILDKISDHIVNLENIDELKNDPLIKVLYNFERLKGDLNKFYSFNLNKNGVVIRLIVSLNEVSQVDFVYISFDHYKDFSEDRVIYYDE